MNIKHYLKHILLGGLLTYSGGLLAQDKTFYNKGLFFVKDGTIVSSKFSFENNEEGNFENQGELYLFESFTNNGLFGDSKQQTGKVVFDKGSGKFIVDGTASSFFKDIEFNSEEGVSVEGEITIGGEANFERGHVFVAVTADVGGLIFRDGASVKNAADDRHIVGRAEREGKDARDFPVGDGQYLREAGLGVSNGINDLFSVEYKRANPLLDGRVLEKGSAIQFIDDKEYWAVTTEKGGNVILTLSWDKRSTPEAVYNVKKGQALHIVRWDETNKTWVDEGGVKVEGQGVEGEIGFVSTPVEIAADGIFTLAAIDEEFNTEVKIFNLVTPNGDGYNDYFIVENINRYPNSVEIVNRWGAKVYSATNYDPNGDGSTNVFTGESTGKGVIGKGKLPSGTYYYIVKYEVSDSAGTRWVKKAGYLQLESN